MVATIGYLVQKTGVHFPLYMGELLVCTKRSSPGVHSLRKRDLQIDELEMLSFATLPS
jgi:hypothetical protein